MTDDDYDERADQVEVFAHLLREACPGDEMHSAPDNDPEFWFFRVAPGPTPRHVIRVAREFLDDNSEGAVRTRFPDVMREIRRAGAAPVGIDHHRVRWHGKT